MADSELCEKYGWTWQELQDTPLYVRIYFQHVQSMKNAKANEDAKPSRRPHA